MSYDKSSGADVVRDRSIEVMLPPAESGSLSNQRCDGRTRPIGCCEFPLVDIGLAPGDVEQRIVRWMPGQSASLHHTHSIDVDVILSGSIDLVLRETALPLTEGDMLIVDGVVHGWTAGPEGCVMSVTLIAG